MRLLLAKPRGFCAGVERAVAIVEQTLLRFGAPIYVRHEIVHNRAVVESLKTQGVIFIDEIDQVPHGAVVIFSAHGVSKNVRREAEMRELTQIDATCPLVRKVHSSVEQHQLNRQRIILIGHAGHPEVLGTMGQVPKGEMLLVGSVEDVWSLPPLDGKHLAYTTQTTLSVDDAREIIKTLRTRFPGIQGQNKGDICYATTNRQQAVQAMAAALDALVVVGSSNSSNSCRLREIGEQAGVRTYQVDGAADLNPEWFSPDDHLGITSGASTPESSVQEVVNWLQGVFPVSSVEEFPLMQENVHFPLPAELR
jgi:4-hydroxy-3-methylbut-2-enyl diphosphate reductase